MVSFDSEFLKKLEYLFLVSRRIFRGQLRSERRSRAVGASVEFADYRNYILGDDLRYIDWNAYGRINRLFIKLFEEEEDLHIYLLVDVSRSMRFGQPSKLDYAKRVAAALAYIGLASLDRVDVLYFGGQMEGQMGMSRGKGQIHKVLQFLERDPEPRNPVTSFHSALLNFVHQNKHRGLAVVLSDFFDPDFESGIRLLQYHKFDVCLLQVLDPIDLDPSLLGDFRLIDGESGLGREVTVNEDLLVRYRRTVREFNDRINRFATQRQISYLRTATTTPFDELVLKLLRQGKFVA